MIKICKWHSCIFCCTLYKISLVAFGAGWASVFPNNLPLYLKDLKLLLFVIWALKSIALSFE